MAKAKGLSPTDLLFLVADRARHDQAAAAKAAAAPKATAKAKAKAKAESGGGSRGRSTSRGVGDDGVQKVCTFFNHDGCKKGADCNFKHVIVSAEAKKKLPQPRSSSPTGAKKDAGGSGGKGRGRGSGKGSSAAPAGSARQWCAFFLKEGGCRNESTCKFPHLYADAVEAIKKANKASKE